VASLFTSIDFWRLRPAPEVLAEQPGTASVSKFVMAAAYPGNDVIVLYTPEAGALSVKAEAVPEGRATWFDPRTGARAPAKGTRERENVRFETPGEGDWVLLCESVVHKSDDDYYEIPAPKKRKPRGASEP
jgi:hypothetical protein